MSVYFPLIALVSPLLDLQLCSRMEFSWFQSNVHKRAVETRASDSALVSSYGRPPSTLRKQQDHLLRLRVP